jgi:hypothetical protein
MAYILKALLERGHKLAEGLGVVGVARGKTSWPIGTLYNPYV